MMNRNMVNTTSVNIKMLSKIFHRHSRTFNMPARITTTPRRIPSHSLIFKLRFCKPKNKVSRITFIFINNNNLAFSSSCFKFIKIQISQFSVIIKSRNIKIQVAASHISMTISFNLLNQINHFLNVICSLTNNIRMTDIQSINISHKSICIEFSNFKNRLMSFFGCFFHFIFAVISIPS